MLGSISNSIVGIIPVRSVVTTFSRGMSKKVCTKIKVNQIDCLKSTAMSQAEFTEKYCSSFEEFVAKNETLIQKVGLSSHEAFQKMIKNSYENYLRHQGIIEPGRIF